MRVVLVMVVLIVVEIYEPLAAGKPSASLVYKIVTDNHIRLQATLIQY